MKQWQLKLVSFGSELDMSNARTILRHDALLVSCASSRYLQRTQISYCRVSKAKLTPRISDNANIVRRTLWTPEVGLTGARLA